MPNISDTFDLALQHHRAGNLAQARDLYCQILDADPNHIDALHLLGMIAHQAGQHELAIALIRKSIAAGGVNAILYSNLGAAHQALGQLSVAAACYRQALHLQPDSAESHNNLGVALMEQGRADEAIASFQQALKLQPQFAMSHNNLGNILKEQGKLAEAEASYRQALRFQPEFVLAHNNLGNVLKDQGKLAEAETCYRQAMNLQPEFAEVHNNLGSVLRSQGKLTEAITSYEQALRLKPDFAEAHNNLGVALMDQGKLKEALPHYQQAVTLRTEDTSAQNNLGVALMEEGKLQEALACFFEAVRIQPDSVEAHNNLGNALMKQGKREEAIACYREALRLKPDFAYAHSNLLFSLNYDPHADPDAVFAEHRRWGTLRGLEGAGRAAATAPPVHDPDPERRLRIGYVSPDFRGHALICCFEPILANHHPDRVEAICYAEVRAPDATTARLQALAHGWRSTIGLNDAQMADLIRQDRIDILVDLAGHTANHRLRVFAHKPAPVQVTYLGYPNTTGLTTVDYRLTDAVLDPPGAPWGTRYTEQLVRLEAGFCCFAAPQAAPEINPLPATQAGRVTFGSLHNLAKLNDDVVNLWCQVLQAVPTARLLLFRNTLTGETRDFIRRLFTERGIAADRLELRHEGNPLAAYADIDLSLDVFPWTGHVISCESLWMGVPVLTLRGKRAASRLTASVLTRLGLTDLIADSPEQYVSLAISLARDLDRLAQLRCELRERMRTRVGDGLVFTRGLEEAYRVMWHNCCAGRTEKK